MSSNIDSLFYGKATIAFHEHEGESSAGLEEAFIQTTALGNGFTLQAGRFYSAMGYLNEQHEHAWDFADAPLIYRGLFGDQYSDDGLQFVYIAPTDIFLQFGAEAFSGKSYPSSGEHSGVGAWTIFTSLGGDIGIEHSWQFGLSSWQASDVDARSSAEHMHDGASSETPLFSGSSEINALDFVYKWAANGNPQRQHFKFQFEYFERKENGIVSLLNSGPPEELTYYRGTQSGWYTQLIYQFIPHWRSGLRYDNLSSDNWGEDADVISEAGLDDEGISPERYSVMLEWLPSEYSRVRLQYNRDDSYMESDNQVFVQYTVSLGSHGAHQY